MVVGKILWDSLQKDLPCEALLFLKSESQLEDSSSRNYQQSNTRQDSKEQMSKNDAREANFPPLTTYSHVGSSKKKKKKSY